MKKIRLTKKLRAAALHHLDLKERGAHPVGEFDKAGRWWPVTRYACCESIRTPSRAYPYSLITHCRTVEHVAHECGYEPTVLRAAVARVKKEIEGDEK